MSEEFIQVTVVYSPAARQWVQYPLTLPAGSSVLAALQASGVLVHHPDIVLDGEAFALGVWGRKAGEADVLRDQDRVEIYRPLKVDPKVARRERFQKQGARSAGLFSKRRPGAKPGY